MERAAGLAQGDSVQVKFDKLAAVLAQTSTSKQDAALFSNMLSLPKRWSLPRARPGTAATAAENPGSAHRASRAGLRWFTEGFDTRDLKEAKMLLDGLTS
jgi:hypothetical protein